MNLWKLLKVIFVTTLVALAYALLSNRDFEELSQTKYDCNEVRRHMLNNDYVPDRVLIYCNRRSLDDQTSGSSN
jgi:hypothetical protein